MKIRERYDSIIPKLMGAGAMNILAIMLYPFIFYRGNEVTLRIRRHEWRHALDVKEFGFFYFYGTYVWEYIKGRFKGLSHYEAYLAISWEVRAREFENSGINPWEDN